MKVENRNRCRLCNSDAPHRVFVAYEMMYGSRESFDYFECAQCGTVQIIDIPSPEQLARHYPPDYYSFSASGSSVIVSMLQMERDKALLGCPTVIGSMIAYAKPDTLLKIIGSLNLNSNAAILDIGCGSGALLDRLGACGFTSLHGADAFISDNFITPHGARIIKADISEVAGKFDLVMFHHSLEHVPSPINALMAARERLPVGGYCLVRIPTVSSVAWREYGIDWFQLDAPRHIVLPSREGIRLAAQSAGFELISTIDDSIPQQFEISEMYRAGIPLRGDRQPLKFTSRQKRSFAKKAVKANAESVGDQAAFTFRAV